MTRYEATWTVSVDIEEPSDSDFTEPLMLSMHVFVEAQDLSQLLYDDLRKIEGPRTIENVVIRPLAARRG